MECSKYNYTNDEMKISKPLLSYLRSAAEARPLCRNHGKINFLRNPTTFDSRSLNFIQRRFARAPAEEPDFVSIVDAPAQLIRQRRRHGPGLIVLGSQSFSLTSTISANSSISSNANHIVWIRLLASAASWMEDRSYGSLRGSTCSRPFTSTSHH